MEPIDVYLKYIPEILIQFITALLCGGIIGWERERHGKSSGPRTMIFICFGSALYVIISNIVLDVTKSGNYDPSRVLSQIVVGVGFIGAGAIIQSRGNIQGLTTAATIWVVAAIGATIGLGFPLIGITLTVFVLITLILLGKIEHKYLKSKRNNHKNAED